jgi:glycine/D-amino acid oxidase-like deaminating enzyme
MNCQSPVVSMPALDYTIIGGGIVGLAAAWQLGGEAAMGEDRPARKGTRTRPPSDRSQFRCYPFRDLLQTR